MTLPPPPPPPAADADEQPVEAEWLPTESEVQAAYDGTDGTEPNPDAEAQAAALIEADDSQAGYAPDAGAVEVGIAPPEAGA